uniref:NADH-ubiquinone oxidoreductase chain 2 n=1 Tax=Metopiellus crypticus TaxID=3140185 RepID=A0AAT9QDE3_9COLE|nr:NADH dehydrogenase subunit 2 [Metopiellus sp.]UUK33557.1 NADH dehydrogenase subunit 2 [Metopiellus sp.]UUK33570.1 NADH dehydrogenase subunit 2 [Metopiellus sp.]
MLIISTLITISSNSWMGMWMGLEINLLSIIPLMNNIKNNYTAESSIKYFIIQIISSLIILMNLIFLMKFNNFYIFNKMTNMIMNSALMMKMGSAPFHFWFPEIIEGLNWMNCFILLTWQKISPFILLNYFLKNNIFTFIIITLNILIGGLIGLNQIKLKKLLTFSSISHIGWMLSILMLSESLWLFYLMIYFIIMINMIYLLNKLQIFFMNHYFFMSYLMIFFFNLNFFNLIGIPPFIGFFSKWFTIQMLISYKWMFLVYFMMLFTLISFFYYFRMLILPMNLNLNKNFLMNMKINFFMFFMNFFNLFTFIFLPMISSLI